jgi:hypothetical protein
MLGVTDDRAVHHFASRLAEVIVIVVAAAHALGPPVSASFDSNDRWSSAMTIDSLPFSDPDVDTSAATNDEGEPTPTCAQVRNTVWYTFAPETDTALSLRAIPAIVPGNAYDVVIAVYTGVTLDSLSEVSCVDARAVNAPEHLALALPAGQ